MYPPGFAVYITLGIAERVNINRKDRNETWLRHRLRPERLGVA